jgi:cell division protein FtsQ
MTSTQQRRPVVRSQVDPRIVERRRTVLEARRRRRRNRWIAVSVLLGAVAAALAVLWSPLTDVDRVVVEGATTIDPDAVRAAAGIAPGDQLVVVDLALARDGVRDLPTVAAASVVREWPDTIRVVVVEEVPLVRLRSGETVRVVSTSGRVLPPELPDTDDLPDDEGLPILDVADAGLEPGAQVPDQIVAALVVLARMSPSLGAELSSSALAPDGTLSFTLADGGTVRFGPVEDVPAKLLAIEAFLDQVTRECLDVLDVGRPDRPTASRVAGCVVPPPTETAVGDAPIEDGTTDGAGSATDADSGVVVDVPA